MVPRPVRTAHPVFVSFTDLLNLVACPLRRELLVRVARAATASSVLADQLGLERSHVSTYLGALESAGLVCYTREGKWHVYRLGPAASAEFDARGRAVLTLRCDEEEHEVVLKLKAAEVLRPVPAPMAEPKAERLATRVSRVIPADAAPGPVGNGQAAHRPANGHG